MVVALAGCAGWQAVQLAPASFDPGPPEMRVTRLDGWQAVLASPRFEHDTIRGVRNEAPFDSIALAAPEVRSVAIPRHEERETLTRVGVLAGIVLIFTSIVYLGGHAAD